MDLTIHQNCPSCGAPIELHEADRLICCPYCDVNNFMVTRGPLRFVLPDKAPGHIERSEMFYAPYLRFKGNSFFCKGNQQSYKVVDTTQQGVNARALPPSLGLRPQAMPIFLATDEVKGFFLRQTVMAKTLLEQASLLPGNGFDESANPFYHQAYIGETLSSIYLPLYIDNGVLHDAVTNTPLAYGGSAEKMREKGSRYRESWTPHFLATLCPKCGDSLTGEHDSLVLSCYNCHTSWEERRGTFHSIDWNCIVSRHKEMYYLPFWKLRVRSTGAVMDSFADFLQMTNQPRVILDTHRAMELTFWVPAFKVRPSTFLRLGGAIMLGQEKIPMGHDTMVKGMHPVTLQRKEAIQALKSLMAGVALNKGKLLPLLPDINFHPVATELTYLPFFDRGHDFVQEQTGIAVAKSVLRFGRKL